MSVRFDPRLLSEEELAEVRRPTPNAPQPPRVVPQDVPQSSAAPPRPTEAFPQPPTGPPPMRRDRRDVALPFRPSE